MNWEENAHSVFHTIKSPVLWKEAHKTSVQDLASAVSGEMFQLMIIHMCIRQICVGLQEKPIHLSISP